MTNLEIRTMIIKFKKNSGFSTIVNQPEEGEIYARPGSHHDVHYDEKYKADALHIFITKPFSFHTSLCLLKISTYSVLSLSIQIVTI